MKQAKQVRESVKERQALTVAAIASEKGLQIPLPELPEIADIIELRLDSLGWDEPILSFAKACPLPLLITARGPAEGGSGNLNLNDRTTAYRTLMPYASLIDIEMRDFCELSLVIEEARKEDLLLVGSFHHFERTPDLDELLEKLTISADLHKFALQANTKEDLGIHLDLVEQETPMSVMGMGPLGAAARPLMAKAGSVLNYGYAGDTPTAPSQWPCKLLKEALAI